MRERWQKAHRPATISPFGRVISYEKPRDFYFVGSWPSRWLAGETPRPGLEPEPSWLYQKGFPPATETAPAPLTAALSRWRRIGDCWKPGPSTYTAVDALPSSCLGHLAPMRQHKTVPPNPPRCTASSPLTREINPCKSTSTHQPIIFADNQYNRSSVPVCLRNTSPSNLLFQASVSVAVRPCVPSRCRG